MKRVRALAAVAALALSFACSNNSKSPAIVPSGGSDVSAFVTGLAALGATNTGAVEHTGTVSNPTGGPTPTLNGPSSVVVGGGNMYAIHASSAFQHVFLSVGNAGTAVTPSGYWQLDLPAAVTDVNVLATFGSALPTSFDLQFQVTNAAGQGGSIVPMTLTLNSNATNVLPVVTATYTPNPAPFLGGVNCVLSLTPGCMWEFKVVLQEFNGIGVSGATYSETYTFGGTTVPGSQTLLVSIPPRGLATVSRNFACGTGGTACLTPAQLNGGTYTFTITGADANGAAFNLTGPVLTLNKSQ